MNNTELKVLLSASPKKLSLANLSKEDTYRLSISVKNTSFEVFFIPSQYRKLYVSLSAIGVCNRPYPIFHRVSWYNTFDGMFLCIDDPTRHETGIAPTYFFGQKQTNYLDLLCDIINKFLEIYNISYNDLTIISSSNGGFAALWCTRKFPGSTCLAFNPQFDIPLYLQNIRRDVRKKFESALSINFDDSSLANRFYLYDILKEEKSKICIYSNIQSPSDKIQIDSLFRMNNKKYCLGLQKINNIWFIIVELDGVDKHLVLPLPYIVRIIEQLMHEEWGGMEISHKKIEIIDAFIHSMRDYYALQKIISQQKSIN
ncbi:hypothetical protein [Desulfovibrio sp. ZJ200]|uniref:hypothetical protein n=1 Tax=Desulfovibrio sp. ZJ200 TaxID=2709792 RepID=UPI0013EC24F4|nr:hypothetical protein [Desulfovibrio sp. ZJ200]